jgi:hypothetical protein
MKYSFELFSDRAKSHAGTLGRIESRYRRLLRAIALSGWISVLGVGYAIAQSQATSGVPLQARPQPEPGANQNPDSNLLQIVIETSRIRPTVGTGLGVEALIKNVSTKTVYLQERTTALNIPPELRGPFGGINSTWGFFPTQHTFVDAGQPDPWDGHVTLAPGSSYVVAWSNGPDTTPYTGSWGFIPNMMLVIASELNFIFFNPGDYKIAIIAQYWTAPGYAANGYQTAMQEATVGVEAPQSVILFGSALGGLIAYFIFPRRVVEPPHAETKVGIAMAYALKWARTAAGMAGAMLLSAIVTILLARISETQFLIRVTVSDFWGAIAVGFVANYIGVKIFEKIVPAPSGEDNALKAEDEKSQPDESLPPPKNSPAEATGH